MRPTRGHPVPAGGWGPARGPLGRARDAVAPYLLTRLVGLGLPRINAVRAELGMPPLRELFGLLDGCARVLVMTSPAFDPPPARLPGNVRYVGPVTDDPAWAEPWAAPWPEDDDRPLVLVAMSSTYQAHQGVLNRVVDALAGLPVRGLVTLGPGLRAGEVSAAPNVAVVRSAPHAAVLPRAAAVITHAGHGSVMKALAAGVPMVCIPHGWDQGDNTTRVLAAGAGLRASRRAQVPALRAAVRRVLDDPSYRAAARRLADALAAEAVRRPGAVQEVEAVLARGAV